MAEKLRFQNSPEIDDINVRSAILQSRLILHVLLFLLFTVKIFILAFSMIFRVYFLEKMTEEIQFQQ